MNQWFLRALLPHISVIVESKYVAIENYDWGSMFLIRFNDSSTIRVYAGTIEKNPVNLSIGISILMNNGTVFPIIDTYIPAGYIDQRTEAVLNVFANIVKSYFI